MLSGIPEKIEEAAATKFLSAARDIIWAFRALRERRRIRNLHLDGRDRRHGEIAAIKRGRDQREGASL
jgi:hypothetical protein